MPLEIVGLNKNTVRFVWSADDEDTFTAQTLRQKCSCAYCQSETTGERILDPESVPADITVTSMELTGNYGVNMHFSDGHTTGIYRFRMLRELAQEAATT